jgi:hypothetical protein
LGGFSIGHGHKTTQLDHLGLDGVGGGRFVEGIVDGEQFVVVRPGNVNFFKTHTLAVAAVTNGFFAPRLVNVDGAHGLGGGTEKNTRVQRSLDSCRSPSQHTRRGALSSARKLRYDKPVNPQRVRYVAINHFWH